MTTQTHNAVITASIRGDLQILRVPTIPPSAEEVLVKVECVASTPLDLHQNDGGLLVKHPQVLGDGMAGSVVRVGEGVRGLGVGDLVFGFTWREQKEKAHQEYVTVPWYLLGKVPSGFTLQQAVTLPNNFVTVFHAATTDLGLELPWPRPSDPKPLRADECILIWGGSSSVGQYAIQILKYYGYKNIIATASKKHHTLLKELGASQAFDYRDSAVVDDILRANAKIPLILDCIGSQSGSLAPLAKIAQKGSKVAVLLPVIVKDATKDGAPEYTMDVETSAPWAEGVEVAGVRTHFYLQNELFKEKLQPEIMPTLLAEGVVRPNNFRIIEGKTLLERAQRAMDALRNKEASGERLVWRISQ